MRYHEQIAATGASEGEGGDMPAPDTAPVVFWNAANVHHHVGSVLGTTEWMTVEPKQVIEFYGAVGGEETELRGTAAPGVFLLASVVPKMQAFYEFPTKRFGLNYGLNNVRFGSPPPVDTRYRATFTLAAVEEKSDGGLQISWGIEIETSNGGASDCSGETVTRVYL